ncbi:hypothetical protein DM860_014493 [Cuscuta australis]|uniref:Uncharacterized protein n=1 Tax=Cuscuta australis TaxID=267555 RepID=A0A328E284_9ASTE|nr:hypothetical protein DM860_014493 [Cuscuta australis]
MAILSKLNSLTAKEDAFASPIFKVTKSQNTDYSFDDQLNSNSEIRSLTIAIPTPRCINLSIPRCIVIVVSAICTISFFFIKQNGQQLPRKYHRTKFDARVVCYRMRSPEEGEEAPIHWTWPMHDLLIESFLEEQDNEKWTKWCIHNGSSP